MKESKVEPMVQRLSLAELLVVLAVACFLTIVMLPAVAGAL